jgi:cation:H+ antiporter
VVTSLHIATLIAGIAILYWGAEWLIRGSATLARRFGVRALVIGLTVVAYGTSAPEVAVATSLAREHETPMALGVVIGACIANLSLVLGLTALIAPPKIEAGMIRREIPILLGSAIAVPLMLRDRIISRTEGMILIACAALFTIVTLALASRDDLDEDEAEQAHTATEAGASYGGRARPRGSPLIAIVMAAFGLALLVIGAKFYVHGARELAGQFGMSDRMTGLSIIAIGTSLPELIASLIAATRGNASLAIGSVIGSNLLNVFLVLGLVAYLRPIDISERMHVVDLIGLVGITFLAVFFLRGARRISRLEGGILVAAYVGFIVAAALL